MEKREFTNGKLTLVFYQKENDTKFSFLVKNEPELTEKLLVSVKTKRISGKNIKYAVKSIFEKLENIYLLTKNSKTMENQNPITKLAEIIQAQYGSNIETEVLSKTGLDHNPTITVKISLPNGNEYLASASNKRIAKRIAAQKALDEEGLN